MLSGAALSLDSFTTLKPPNKECEVMTLGNMPIWSQEKKMTSTDMDNNLGSSPPSPQNYLVLQRVWDSGGARAFNKHVIEAS